jgi:phosphoribosylaminoimidazole carboxylase PurE protein
MGSIIVIMGSGSDLPFAERIRKFLVDEKVPVKCRFEVASAHRTPDVLLQRLETYEESGRDIVYITVAGLSDALSGVVAGCTKHPVIACPPDLEKFGWAKAFSSAMTPKGVPVLLATRPENAALAAAKILALTDRGLYKNVEEYMSRRRAEALKAGEALRGEPPGSQ